jgi:hypothetical protein
MTETCICGANTDDACEAAHWNSPNGSTLIIFSCSPECADKIESLRVNGRLTVSMIRKAH